MPFFDAVRGSFGPNFNDAVGSMEGRHEEELRSALWGRHRELEQLTGRKLPLSSSMVGVPTAERDPLKRLMDEVAPTDAVNAAILGRPGHLDDDAYEDLIDGMRAKEPGLAGIKSRKQMIDDLAASWNVSRDKAQAMAAKGPGGMIGALGGQIAGTMADPRQAALAIATGGWGAGRPIATRMVAQGGAGVLGTLLPAGEKMEDARKLGGPKYDVGDVAEEAGFAAAGGMILEGVGGVARAGWRNFRGVHDVAPEVRGALNVMDQAARDDAAVGPLAGQDYDNAIEALATGRAAPAVEPDRDLGDLFSPEAGGAPGVAIYKGRPIYTDAFDPAALATDPGRFQYKAGGDAEGVTARLKGVEAWDPLAAGRVMVWEDRSGARFIADGHQRFGLVRRLNDDRGFDHQMDGYLFREADGWRAQDVRTVAALKNIREGSGSPLDAAKVFRDAPDALADRSLPVTGDFMAQARGLAQLSDEAFGAVVNRVIQERYAAEIGVIARDRADLHMDMVRLMKAAQPANLDEARALAVEALQDDWIKAEGTEQDLFGYDPSQSAMIARAKVAATVKRSLARDARLFSGLVRNADAIEAGGNALARDANEARLAVDRAALEVTAKLAMRHGPVGEAMADAAKRVAKGESPATAARDVLARVREAIEAGERLDEARGVTLDPAPPSPSARALLDGFDDPAGAGAKAQAEAAPEDLAFEEGPAAAQRQAIDTVLEAARGPGHAPQKAVLGDASDWLVEEAKAAGLDLGGFTHVIDGSAVRHTIKSHGDVVKETARGQVAVTEADFHAVPEILSTPDRVVFGATGKRGEGQVIYVKAMGDGSTLVVEEVRTGRHDLAVQSMRKYPAAIDDSRLAGLVDPNARSDGGDGLKIVAPPEGASAIAAPDDLQAGLFDDLAPVGGHQRAHEALKACAPGGGE